jgi:imidazolonepropionase-like amidohydrolase
VEEALANVRYAKEHGYIGVKLYGSIDPAWVAPIAAEAHRLGLRVSGHVPAGMRPLDAVRAGYDEITHLNFTFMQAMPDDVVAASNGLQRFFGPGRYAADVDFSRAPMKPFLSELARRRITLDPTLSVFEAIFVPERGQVAPAYAPYVGAVPPAVEREFKSGGLQPPEGLSRERMRASFARMREAIREIHRRGIPIIAGTDGIGHELIRELELYVEAGLSPADALATATIAPARVFGWDDRTGSIKAGKLAELNLVEGDPEARIGDLRRVVMVMRDGRLMDAAALRAALGLGAPR